MQDLDQATQLKLVTLTFECSHQRYVSQLGNGPVRDHVDVASMMRSVPPAVKPLMADHRPKAKCSSCRNQNGAWHSGDKKVRFRAQNQYIDDDGSEYETADEGEDDEKKTLLKWGNERSGTETNIIENNWIRRPSARVHDCPSRFDLSDPSPFSLVRSTTPEQNQSIFKNIEMERIHGEYETELVTALPKNVLVTHSTPAPIRPWHILFYDFVLRLIGTSHTYGPRIDRASLRLPDLHADVLANVTSAVSGSNKVAGGHATIAGGSH
ncbi:MAG: hypothetical protein Q9205_000540 [Flavoplaca limonia]